MTEIEILSILDELINLLHLENTLLKTHQTDAAMELTDKKEQLGVRYMEARDAIITLINPSNKFIESAMQKNEILLNLAEENAETLNIVLSANKRVVTAVADKLNEKNRPAMMYSANARERNLNKYMPPAMALNERL